MQKNRASAQALTKSLQDSGVAATLRRFAHVPQEQILTAATLLTFTKAPPHDSGVKVFTSGGFRWAISDVLGLDGWNMTVSQSDGSRRSQLSISFSVCDVATGVGSPSSVDEALQVIRKDSVLRLQIARAVADAARLHMEDSLVSSTVAIPTFKQNARALATALMRVGRLFPYINISPRVAPAHAGIPDQQRILVDVSVTMVVELYIPTRNEGSTLTSVQIEENSTYFTLTAEADKAIKILKGVGRKKYGRAAETIEAISAPLRRRRNKQLLEETSIPITRQEVIQVGESDSQESPTVDIVMDETGHPFLHRVAGIQEDVRKSEQWWSQHRTLIKPPLNELAANMMVMFGESPTKSDVPTLVDMALPQLEKIAKQRQPSIGDAFGLDAAVAGLGQLLEQELKSRIR